MELYPVSEKLRLQLKTEHLLHLLEKGQTDEAFQVKVHSRKNVFQETRPKCRGKSDIAINIQKNLVPHQQSLYIHMQNLSMELKYIIILNYIHIS